MSFFAMEGGNDSPYRALRPQGPPVLDEGSPFSDLRFYPLDPQAYFTGVHSSLLSSPIQGIDRGRTNYPESALLPLTLRGHGVPPASIEDQTCTKLRSEGRYINSSSLLSSNLTKIPMEKRTDVSFQLAGRPGGTPERQYSCDICGERYAQRQGVSRHRREAHNNPHLCSYCGFRWSRPDQYRTHLKKRHPDVDRDHVLGKPAGSRRKSAIIGRNLPHHFPPPAIEAGQRSQAEPTLFFPAVEEVTHVRSPMVYPQFKCADSEPAIATSKHEDAHGLEYQRGAILVARLGGSAAADCPFGPVTPHLLTQPLDGNPDFMGPFAGPCNLIRSPLGDLIRPSEDTSTYIPTGWEHHTKPSGTATLGKKNLVSPVRARWMDTRPISTASSLI